MNTEKLVAAYINLRDAISDHDAEIKALKEKQQLIADELLGLCAEENADSIRTPAGTVSRRLNSTYWTSDWEEMYKFIEKHNAPFLLEKRISTSSMRDFLEQNPDESPVGLQAKRNYIISIRKPTAK